jgi:hypothetical protein
VDVDQKGAAGDDVGALSPGKAAGRLLAASDGTNRAHGRDGGGAGDHASGGSYRRRSGLAAHGKRTGALTRNDANRNRL